MDFATATLINKLAVLDRERMRSSDPPLEAIAKLQDMNRAGFLTVGSANGDRFGDYDERAFVEGFLRRDRAVVFAERFNTSTDKLAMITHPSTKHASPSQIPVVFEAGAARTGLRPYRKAAEVDVMRRHAGLSPAEDVVLVVCIDPLWGRPAVAEDGLFTEVLGALQIS